MALNVDGGSMRHGARVWRFASALLATGACVVASACKERGFDNAAGWAWLKTLPAAATPAMCSSEDACRTECETGNDASCIRLAKWSRVEHGDFARAAALLTGACDRAFQEACVELALLDFQPQYEARDARRGLALIERASERGSRRACDLLTDTYATGSGAAKDEKRAEQLNERCINLARIACDAGSGDDCAALANDMLKRRFWRGGKLEPQETSAVGDLLQRACTLGSAGGCAAFGGTFLVTGHEDHAFAYQLFSRACDLDPAECTSAAYAIWQGQGVSKDPERARRLYGRACSAWSAEACYWLAAKPDRNRATDPIQPFNAHERACRIKPNTSCAAGMR